MENLKDKLITLSEMKIIKKTDVEKFYVDILKSGLSLEDYLIENKFLSENKLYEGLATYYELPFAHLDILEINQQLIDKFGINYMKKHRVVPIKINEKGTLILATSKPLDFFVL